MIRLLITGSRDWSDRAFIEARLRAFGDQHDGQVTLIQGEARGADSLCRDVGRELGWTVESYPALWDVHGRAAGPIRNQQMLDQHPDCCIAFSRDIKTSRGTRDMCKRVYRAGLPLEINQPGKQVLRFNG